MSDSNRSDIPQVLPWDKRFKGVLPLPGGYDGYLNSLKDVCRYIRDDRPRRDELHGWLENRFSLTSTSAYHRVAFLLKVGLLDMDGDVCGVAEPTQRWHNNGDAAVVIAQIHSRTQFIGEMLHEVKVAQDAQSTLHTWDLLAAAAESAYRTLISECANVGPMSVRDLWLTLRYQDPEQSWAEDEIREVLVILSSDLVAAVELAPGSSESPKTYVPATSLEVAQLRLRKLADALGATKP